MDFVQTLNPDHVLECETDWQDYVKDMDVVLDLVGGDTFKKVCSTLRKDGTLVTAVEFPGDEAGMFGIKVARLRAQSNAGQLATIAQLAEVEKLKVYIDTVLPLSQVKGALDLSASRGRRGKIVLQVQAHAL